MTKVVRESFGSLPDGTVAEMVRLCGDNGFEARVITFGASLQALFVADRDGRPADVILGQDDLDGYVARRRFLGATVGRYANRIANAAFVLDGQRFQLPANEGTNALHGGHKGFDSRNWTIAALGETPAPFVTLSYLSGDGEEGFPGNLDTRVTYAILDGTSLAVTFSATSDKPTVVNLTNHSFFNLAGVEASGGILDHVLTIAADTFLPVDEKAIPLAASAKVEGTAFDFRSARRVGARIHDADPQLVLRRGYDHTFPLHGNARGEPRLAARLEHPTSGRVLELLTDQSGVQFYSGNFLDGSIVGKYRRVHRQYDALCLEPQVFPNTPNRSDFPSARLDPGQTYRQRSIYRFSVA